MTEDIMSAEEFEAGLRTLTPEQLQEVQRQFDEAEGKETEDSELRKATKEFEKPETIPLSGYQEDFMFELIKARASPDKAKTFVLENPALDYEDIDVKRLIESQRLLPTKIYREKVVERLKNDFVNKTMEDPSVPTNVIEQMHHARTKAEAQKILRSYEQQLIDDEQDRANFHINQQYEAVKTLSLELARRIASIRAKTLPEAKSKVEQAIRNYQAR